MIFVMGGDTKLFAAIGVTYPAGSTLTCTNGTSTLKAKTTSGQWVFAIPKAGTWTVTATDGTNSKSQSVSITSEGQSVKMELGYSYEILNSSVNNTGGWYTAEDTDNGCYVTPGANNIILHYVGDGSNNWAVASTKNIFEVGNYSTIKCEVEQSITDSRGPFKFSLTTSTKVGANNDASDGVFESATVTGSGVFSIPIDDIGNTQFYVRFYVTGIGVAPTATLTVKRIWME